jgi:SAM-dependent methyltransferase
MIDEVLARLKASAKLQTLAAGVRTVRWTFQVRRAKRGLPTALVSLPGIAVREARRLRNRYAYYSDQDAAALDAHYGIETRAYVDMNNVTTDASGAPPDRIFQATIYGGTSVALLRRTLRDLGIDHSTHTFVDFGSGKGRALAIASEYPFKKVVGVEFILEMHQVAESNMARIAEAYPERRGVFELHCADAVGWSADALPEGNLVLYFYAPFHPELMVQVLANIERDLSRRPRDLYLIFTGNRAGLHLIEERPFLTLRKKDQDVRGESLFVFAGGTARSEAEVRGKPRETG